MTADRQNLKESEMLGHVTFSTEVNQAATNFELIQRRTKHFAGSFLLYHDPIHIVRGEGAYLFDADNRRYIDCYNNVQSMGHANSSIVRAIAEQSARLTTHTRYLNDQVIELAEAVAATLPGKLDVCFFVCTGTEACELAMRIARVITGNTGSIVMEHSYHGNSKLVGEMSTATYPRDQRPPYIQAVEPPNTYRGPYCEGDDESLGEQYANLIDPAATALKAEGQGVAAFVCDSIFDSNGAIQAPSNYFQKVYRKTRQAGGLCIADEVQAGVCRTGRFWGFEHYDVEPDIVFTGKPFGGGYPVAAVFTTREIAEQWAATDVYFNTFGGNPVAAAAARAVISYAIDTDILGHVNTVSEHLVCGLHQLAQKHECIGRVQGLGLFICVDIVADRKSRKPASDLAASIPDAMKNEGVLIGLTGRHGNCVKFRPPLVFSHADADETLEAFDRVLSRIDQNGAS